MRFLLFSLFLINLIFSSVDAQLYSGKSELAPSVYGDAFAAQKSMVRDAERQLGKYQRQVQAERDEADKKKSIEQAKRAAEKDARRRNQGIIMRSINDEAKYPKGIDLRGEEANLDSANNELNSSPIQKLRRNRRNIKVNVEIN